MVLKENPKVSMTRLVQLIAAKWREFDSMSPYRDQSHSATKKTKEGMYYAGIFGSIMFLSCSTVREYVRPCVHPEEFRK